MIEDIFNYLKIDERIGTGGQPTSDQFADIAKTGYQAVINLAPSTSDNAIPNEGELVSAQGMTYVHLPVDFDDPTCADFEIFSGFMKTLADHKVFVHCAMNMRVSAFVYMHRVHDLGVSSDVAAIDLQRVWEPDKNWQRLMDTVLNPT